jgi:hypothetical protein
MQDGNQIPDEIDLTHVANEPSVTPLNHPTNTESQEQQYGKVAIILGVAIILAIMGMIWILLQPGTPNVPANLPLPGSTPAKSAQPSLNQTK